jgi:hypothetical protein
MKQQRLEEHRRDGCVRKSKVDHAQSGITAALFKGEKQEEKKAVP